MLKYTLLASVLAAMAYASKAPEVLDNPNNVVAVAHFPQAGDSREIMGTMKFFSVNGTVKVHWDVTKLPYGRGPFYYHIHENALNGAADCEVTGRHFNPYSAPPDCSKQAHDSLCQVGDLSGKHGWIDTTCYETSYYDPYLSLKAGDPAYLIGKSVVLHFPDLKKMACADIGVSPETPQEADLESKRNVLHNKDLIEAKTPGWQPTEQERALMDESHREWLKYNEEGDVHRNEYGDDDDDDDDDDGDEDEGSEEHAWGSGTDEALDDEADPSPGTPTTELEEQIEDSEFQGEKPCEPSETASSILKSTDCENGAGFMDPQSWFYGAAVVAAGLFM